MTSQDYGIWELGCFILFDFFFLQARDDNHDSCQPQVAMAWLQNSGGGGLLNNSKQRNVAKSI